MAQDGVIFVIASTTTRLRSLKLLMDEVFGAENFQREMIWRIGWLSGYKTMANNFIRSDHDTMLFYSRDREKVGFIKRYLENKSFKQIA